MLRRAEHKRPHRLAAQDGALSRLKQGFESPWGHIKFINADELFVSKPLVLEFSVMKGIYHDRVESKRVD